MLILLVKLIIEVINMEKTGHASLKLKKQAFIPYFTAAT
uniref:Uncharacterized protein n=1 Tax=Elizabethkingia anophelis TaxID=1117645 RepID=A0A455ZDR9_9FLAO|nr:TPA_exp: hypothetical protein [Elizabethkingia anophelis]